MNKLLYKFFAALAFVAMAQMTQAQAFYSQDFSGGSIPMGWTTTDGSPNGILWEYCTDALAGCADLYNQNPFASTTASNGFMILDSDAGGDLPSSHISRLTTDAIDCSAATSVYATFENYIGVFTIPSDGAVLLKVSTDGINWTSYNFIPGLSVSNRFSANPEKAVVNITAVAAGQATVFLQWEWTGNYEYWWMLDDVELTTDDPTFADNLTLSGFYYPVSSFATPESQIGTDTFGFSAFVSNNGLADQTSVTVKVEVVDEADVVLFTDMASVATIPAGYMDSLIVLPNTFAPELPQGLYSIRYSVSADATDLAPEDNADGDDFFVSDFIFSKENGPTGALRPGGGGDYAVANLYQMSSASMENYKTLGFQVSAATNATDGPLEDIAATAYLFKVNDDIDVNFDNFDDADLFSASLELVGVGEVDFPTGAVNYTNYPVLLDDIGGNPGGVSLQNGARYFTVISYTGNSSVAFHAYGDETNHTFVSSMVYTSAWFLGGFGEDYNPVIRMILELSTATDDLPLPESALMLFPNPVNDVLNLEVAFETATDATITIADINGRVIKIDNRKGLMNEVLTYQLPQLAAGTYLARIATEKGTKTKKFVVVK